MNRLTEVMLGAAVTFMAVETADGGETTVELHGKLFSNLTCEGQNHEPGIVLPYEAYVPASVSGGRGLPVLVMLEHDRTILPMLDRFISDGLMPAGLILIPQAGTRPATLPGGADRRMRAEELDQNGREFPDFVVEELIPAAAKIAGVTVSDSPDMHLIAGGSSGGMAAWNAAWYRNDYFRRAFISSPTFSAMRGGEELMVLLRKTETRPIRVFMTVGTNEPDYFFGSSFYAACNAAKAFAFAKYDFKFRLFNGEGHCARRFDEALLREAMEFLWKDWKTEPVRALGNQIRIQNLLDAGSRWTECAGPFPERGAVITEFGSYSFDGGKIVLTRPDGTGETVADGFDELSALALSTDRWLLYATDRRRRFVYALAIKPDGTLAKPYALASLHLAYDCRFVGAIDLCVAADDRVYAATELGIQGIVSFGLADAILPLPGDLPADRVALAFDGGNYLYAASGDRIFRRKVKIGPADPVKPVAPGSPGYDDGFDYSIQHLPQ